MTNVEPTETAAVTAQGAAVAPERPSSKKGAGPKKGAPKGQKSAKAAAPKKTVPARKTGK
jgi:hypothetical protein